MSTTGDLFVAGVLIKIKKEHDKRGILYDHGVDLINYENGYITCLMDSLIFILGDPITKDDLEWWLYETVDKIIWVNGEEFNVEDPLNLLKVLRMGTDKES